ncbi:MAG: glycoside hydrolase family 3 N-terminal domain-containing protein, partial [Bacteroidota bacterium]|nr:glycoside hydrolase family 3 N-terminal domain-containing protein [Bacteroidota bacterium]
MIKQKSVIKSLYICLLSFSILISSSVQIHAQNDSVHSVFLLDVKHEWVDSMLQNLSLEEQIAQLIFVEAYSNRDISHETQIIDLVRKYKIGGLVFFQGNPEKQASLTNFYQSQSKVPLMIAIDADWGLGMRLEKTIEFPFPMTLGAISRDELIYETGKEIGRELRSLGVHLCLAPVLDINNNPDNPVINYRSFGMDKSRVAEKGIMFIQGIQSRHVIACAKHFPGHGDTNIDSHFALPVLQHNLARLDSLELYPFRKAIEKGVGAIMVAHLSIPSIEPTENLASSLSVPVVSGLLKDKMGFKGLVVTDALNMKGVSDYFPPGVVDAKALIAGNDILLNSENVPGAIEEIKKAISQGQISKEEIEYRCRKVLAAKVWTGANKHNEIKIEGLLTYLNTSNARVLKRELVRESITLLKNNSEIIPIRKLEEHKIASLAIGPSNNTSFQNVLDQYTKIDHFSWNPENENLSVILEKLKGYNLVIAGITGLGQRPCKNFGVSTKLEEGVREIITSGNTIISVFGNPFALSKLPGIENAEGLILTYQDNALAHEMAAQLIFGAFGAKGILPVSVNSYFKMGDGLQTAGISRLSFALPEEVGLDSKILHEKIDS